MRLFVFITTVMCLASLGVVAGEAMGLVEPRCTGPTGIGMTLWSGLYGAWGVFLLTRGRKGVNA